MTDPIALLDAPIDWHDPALGAILDDLQGNILKGHGRDHTVNVFLRFDPSRADEVRLAIHNLAGQVTSALRQLTETEDFKKYGRPGGTGIFFAMSAEGYRAIGLTPPGDAAFLDGMAAHRGPLGDPETSAWEEHPTAIHALLIVADDSDTLVANAEVRLTSSLAQSGITIIGRDVGRALRRPAAAGQKKGEGIEHFGYVDGRSQPLLLSEEVTEEAGKEGPFIFKPSFSPREAALVPDPHGGFAESFGSYLVYRKLEQDVAAFKAHEDALADALSLTGADRERAGAMVVGRFEDGTPLVLHKSDVGGPLNNFDYAGDASGLKCPFQAHIRKTNPRGDTVRAFGAPEASERQHLMPRRGIPYGERADLPELEGPFPSGGVGLLFMAYNADIGRQFEFTQISWANNPAFVNDAANNIAKTGLDPIIGQPSTAMLPPVTPEWLPTYGTPPGTPVPFDFAGFVTMKGGEYFFAPSRSALSSL